MKIKMGLKCIDILVVLALNLIRCASSEHILSCNMSDINACKGDNQMCNGTTLQCDCVEGFVYFDGDCETLSSENHYHHGSTAPIITIFALVLIVSGLVLVIRKYNLVDYVRQKINQRRNNDVMYEDVMIGNDDPPLSP